MTLPDSWRGMLFSLATFAIFSFGDGLIKYETTSHPVMECAFFAEIGGVGALLIQAWHTAGLRASLKSRNPRIQALRALCLGLEFLLVVYAFSAMDLATVYTLVLSAPIITALLSPVLTDDRFSPRLLPAILIGFAGVVVALHPGSVPATLHTAAALFSAFLFALGNFIIRRMDRDEPPLTFAFYPSAATLVVTALYMLAVRPPMPAMQDILLMLLTGLCSIGGLTCLARSMQLAQASLVMPFQYTQLIWGAIIGAIVFHDRISTTTLTGATLILLSGLLLLILGRPRAGAAHIGEGA